MANLAEHLAEQDTLDQCENILRHMAALRAAIGAGPRLTVKKETARAADLDRITAIYSDLAKRCRKNLL